MFGPKRKHYQQVSANRESVIQQFLHSGKFIECVAEPNFDAFKQAAKDKLFINRLDTYAFRISENAGLGGMFEVIGTVDIFAANQTESTIRLKLQTGIFPVNFPQWMILVLLIVGLALIPLTIAFLYWTIVLCIFPLIWWFVNFIKIRYFLRVFSGALNIENHWN
jgi:hypothetical protein